MTRQTLANVFPGPQLAGSARGLFSADHMEETAQRAQADSVDSARGLVGSMLESAAAQLLDIPLSDIMLGAWTRLAALQEFATGDKLQSTKTHKFQLSEHKITSSHSPSIELLVHQHRVTEVVIDITLTLVLARTSLRIRQGRIVEIHVSGCQASGEVSHRGHTLFSKESGELEFPRAIKLGDGVEIPPPLGAASG